MNVFEYEYETEAKEGKTHTVCFWWISSLKVIKRNIEEMILAGSKAAEWRLL